MITLDTEIILKLLSIGAILIASIRYFANLGTSISDIKSGVDELRLQQKKMWVEIDKNRRAIQDEEKKNIGMSKDIEFSKDILRNLRDTQKIRLGNHLQNESFEG